MPRRLSIAAIAGVAGILAACASQSTTTHTPTTAALGSPATTGRVPAARYPLTGAPVTDASTAHRPALSIKVDNAPPARPQAGLNAADIVTEELVEGGLTRFFVTFQSQNAPSVGPVRSARPVDADLLQELGGGIFGYSGAALGEIAPVKAHGGAVLLSFDAGDPGFGRVAGRPSPYNIYTSTTALYAVGTRRSPSMGPPPSLFDYSAQPPAGAAPLASGSLRFSNFTSAQWAWNAATHQYQRAQNGVAAMQADGSPITTENVVVLSVDIRPSGIFDQAHNEDPWVVVIGSGRAWILRNGTLTTGVWRRPSSAERLQLLTLDGAPVTLQPGRSWLELLPRPALLSSP